MNFIISILVLIILGCSKFQPATMKDITEVVHSSFQAGVRCGIELGSSSECEEIYNSVTRGQK